VSTERLYPLLKHAQLLLAGLVGPALAPHGVDGRELAVLNALADQDSPSQQETARRLGIDRTTMVALVDALERKGLVQRRPHPEDRRRNVLELTGTGQDTRRRATRASEDAERRFLAALDPDDAKRLKEALRALIAAGPSPDASAQGR
jgi:DNA-binding MarR family transcriptional regulator